MRSRGGPFTGPPFTVSHSDICLYFGNCPHLYHWALPSHYWLLPSHLNLFWILGILISFREIASVRIITMKILECKRQKWIKQPSSRYGHTWKKILCKTLKKYLSSLEAVAVFEFFSISLPRPLSVFFQRNCPKFFAKNLLWFDWQLFVPIRSRL